MDYSREISNSLDYIEDNLFSDSVYEEVFSVVHMSKYHFQRIFAMSTMHTLGDYIKKRRFTAIVRRLRETQDKIIDIALECGYESHEAFTRSFKTYFLNTPSEYRKGKDVNPLLVIEPIDKELIQMIGRSYDVKPTIVSLDERQLFGYRFKTSLQNHRMPEYYFLKLSKRVHEYALTAQDEYAYMVWEECHINVKSLNDIEEYTAFVGMSLQEGSKDSLECLSLGKCDYAVFKLEKNFKYINDLYRFIYFRWLKKSSYVLADRPIIERYSKDFSFGNHTGCMWIMVPVVKEH